MRGPLADALLVQLLPRHELGRPLAHDLEVAAAQPPKPNAQLSMWAVRRLIGSPRSADRRAARGGLRATASRTPRPRPSSSEPAFEHVLTEIRHVAKAR